MLTASLVTYHNSEEKLKKTLNSFQDIPLDKKLFVVDNSENKDLERLFFEQPNVEYFYVGENLGFGKGHNYIINKLKDSSSFHLILNPDIYFAPHVVPELMEYAEGSPQIGIIAPLVIYPNGTIQHSFRRFPKPFDLVIRRIPFLKGCYNRRYEKGHYLENDLKEPFNVDSVMGCFQLFRTNVYIEIEGFDERYFMYLEDVDICRKTLVKGYKVVLYPNAKITHYLEKGSAKSFKLFKIHVESIIKYFNKWGF